MRESDSHDPQLAENVLDAEIVAPQEFLPAAELPVGPVGSVAETANEVSASATSTLHIASPSRFRRSIRSRLWSCCVTFAWVIGTVTEWIIGLTSLVIGLSILATLPGLQFLSLGYLLESCGRIVRTGKLRAGFIGVATIARIGSIAVGSGLTLVPALLASSYYQSSLVLQSYGSRSLGLAILTIILGIAGMLHIAWAVFRGGKLRHFAWPAPLRLWQRWRAGGIYAEACDKLWHALTRWPLVTYFWLGLRGFVGAFLWLCLPTSLLFAASRVENHGFGVLIGLVGAAWLAGVLLYLPFLQANFATDGQWRSLFQVRRVRADFRKAPLACWIALLLTLLLALPLYLLKAELVPREAAWLPSLFFITFILPARWSVGWALARASRRAQPRHFVTRWMARLAALPVVLMYVIVVYITQYISWYGGPSLFEQHAFLLPVPFLGM